jgi:hypothetical protein
MDRRPAVLAVLVALAGCGAVPFDGGGPTRDETLTPAPVTSDGDAIQTRVSTALPPGVRANGLVDASRLRDAHESFVTGRSYTLVLRYEVRGSPEIDGFDRQFTTTARVDGRRFLVEQTDHIDPLERSLFVDDGGYLRIVEGNDTRTRRLDDPGHIEAYTGVGSAIERFLNVENATVRQVTQAGDTYSRIRAVGRTPPAVGGGVADVGNYSVTAYVTAAGFVRTLVVGYERYVGTGSQFVSVRLDYSALGETTVERPDWVAGVSSPTPATPVATETVTTEPTATETTTAVSNATSTAENAGGRRPIPDSVPASRVAGGHSSWRFDTLYRR